MICPLEWGLGHATRMIPVAVKLMEMGQKVYVASGKEHLDLYRSELPGVTCINFPGFRPAYSGHLPQYIPLLLKSPLLIFHIVREHLRLRKVIGEFEIDIVISDNRFGLWNKKIRTVYVTHQPRIPFPRPFRFLEFIGILLHRSIIRKFTLCFIPDLPGESNLSGRLSHGLKLPENVMYIGILSRFSGKDNSYARRAVARGHNTVILSGPEPQRAIFRDKVTEYLKEDELQTAVLEGRPGSGREIGATGNVISYSHLPAPEMEKVISSGEKIITRAGYSTIMELVSLGRSALLVPTPGQTEQEYLAEYLSSKGLFSACNQKNLNKGFEYSPEPVGWTGRMIEESRDLLETALTELLK